jgi:hypothetical protein
MRKWIVDGMSFDDWTRTLAAPAKRRYLWHIVPAGALTFLATRPGPARVAAQEATAKDCLKPGKDCKRSNQCCSGLCRRRKCRRAPGQGSCTREQNQCVDGTNGTDCGIASDGNICLCLVTRRGRSFCANTLQSQCFPCTNDRECVSVTGPGSACFRARPPICIGCTDEGGFCAPRCSGG